MGLAYRREIDGLRAVAVVSVVLYHAGIGPAAGFVGVDIFFVISGYLITALLVREHSATGAIGLADFYARRARRILPAGLVVIAAVLAAVPFLPDIARAPTLQSAAASAVFCANLFFQFTTGGYFDPATSEAPLVHLWSLAVEEQFYLVWPLLLIIVLRWRMDLARVLLMAGAASFLLAEWLTIDHPQAAFYQMPARAWELAAGGLIAVLPARPLPRWAATVGLAITLTACALPLPHFPGWGALPAVAGSVLLLAAVHGGATNSMLASRPFVGVGLISYSLYLWHWPLLAISELMTVGPVPLRDRIGLVGGAVLLAVLSFRFVETPFRRRTSPSVRTIATGIASSATIALLAVGLVAATPPPGLDPASIAKADTSTAFQEQCAYWPMESLDIFPKPGCSPTHESTITLWGDSMAMSFQPGVVVWDPRMGSYTRAGCPPVVGYTDDSRAGVMRELCAAFNAKVVPRLGGDTLVMVAHWGRYGNEAMDALERTVSMVAPRFRSIVIVGETPTIRDASWACLRPGADDCSVPRAEYLAVHGPLHHRMKAIARSHRNVRIIDPAGFFCPGSRCQVTRDGYSLYSDSHHVSSTAAREFAKVTPLFP